MSRAVFPTAPPDSMDWNRHTKKQFRAALTNVYRSYTALKRFTAEDFGESLGAITGEQALSDAAFALIDWAESRSRLDELFKTFCSENPNHSVAKALSPKSKGEKQGRSMFSFETVRVDEQGQVIERIQRRAEYWDVDLGAGVSLTMVRIPGGLFFMGAPESEEGRHSSEGPRHRVRVPEFWIGKYPVTQTHWWQVASLPQVNQVLALDPSSFKGNDHPVEMVSWEDTQEFCRRLSRLSDFTFGLPSEAQWEYACRAGTETSFAFGPTLSTDVANYRSRTTYGKWLKGQDYEQTTPVSQFPPNCWGLYDMHGNVLNWCSDSWHEDYKGAPINGASWMSGELGERVVRGGSWRSSESFCRSAYRAFDQCKARFNAVGFRVVCSSPH